jgi:hypothetical protein
MKPTRRRDGMSECRVVFESVSKYDAKLKGLDDINSIEAAIRYIESICINSDDPAFYWEDGEAMKVQKV